MSNLTNQLVIAEREEVARGIRTLLGSPLITERGSPETFDLVRRRHEPIGKWFDYYCGWKLVVEPRLGHARLVKVRAATDASRPARRLRSGRAPFDRRRYVLLCVVAAELLAAPVTTIGLLADRVSRATATDQVVAAFDTAGRGERMAFVDVLRLLESYGVLEVVDGHTESFVDSDDAKVLYRVDPTLLLHLLAAPTGPSRLAVPAEEVPLRFDELVSELSRERRYGTADRDGGSSDVQRNLWLRHSIFRRLVDDPVLYFDQLIDDERAYLGSPTGRQLLRRAAEQGGFVLEERAEGILFVDPDGMATDSRFPDDTGNAKVAALLVLDEIDGPVTSEQLELVVAGILSRFPRWAKTYRGEDGPRQLAEDAVEVLVNFGLAEVSGGLVQLLPAAARYALGTARTSDTDATEAS
ncbi:TIGR02678 family protein [Saccharopolyspora erythraea]|uniref:TIGR02678 family protein n=1 Tax=Saccharopolyspora erythraea TaxID=1836 RepID=UPI001BAA287C|nr:TIGR02678 family protein [Saccharopolyspora erythraea]QUH00163.1 TIGR02678 family protein [Saccharopolyspora erythraea]